MKKMKCEICGKKVTPKKTWWKGTKYWSINASIVGGTPIDLKGHEECLENINNLVVIPNRTSIMMRRK